ncbi:MAG: G8 domain-containing protein, partial [Halobacteriota archaeon]
MGSLVPEDDATHRAVASGSWGDPSVWLNGDIPTDGARALIDEGVTVTIGQETARLDWLRVEGSLTFDTATDSHLKAEHVVSMSESSVEMGTTETPVQSGVEARVTFLDPGPIDEEEDPERKGRGLLVGGDLSIHGAEKTAWSELASDPSAGDSQLELTEAPTNWEPGDSIVISGIVPNEAQDEERVIESVDGEIVNLDAALDHDHVPPRSDLHAYVSNLSRNVVMASESAETKRRGHVMIMSTATDVRYVAFEELGRTNKDKVLTNPVRNGDSLSSNEDTNVSARYPFHYHHTGIGADPHYAEGVVANGSPGWGVVNHHANAEITDSVTYDVLGAGFVAEAGNERGSFDNCIAIRSKGSGEPIDSRSAGAHGGSPPIDDFGHAGHGFWLQSPLVAVTDCVAAGHRHQAFVWWLRPLLDGDLAECTEVDDSRVTYCPNLPLEYVDRSRIAPLLDAIEDQRFSTDTYDELMMETGKIPSTFAPLAEVSGNVAFASAGGVDFSRHNFKWKHERFSDFNTIEDMTVHGIGPFIDADGDVHEPDLPKHQDSGHQGRGGSVGVSFRYTSNVALTDSRILGIGRENSVGVPFHDYQWTTITDNCRIENWDWGVDTGEHMMDWVRNSTFRDNDYDVNWGFDNVGPAILDNNDLGSVRHEFERLSRKASDVLAFNRTKGVRIDGRSSHVYDSAADAVIFPDEDSLKSVNNIEDIDTVDDETDLVGLTNREMRDEYGICASGRVMPDDAVAVDYVDDGYLDPEGGRTPPTAVHLDATAADPIGMFEVISHEDVAGGRCLRSVDTDSPKDDPASLSFDCAAGTYEIYFRFQPGSWNGDDIHYRIDGGDWYTAEKLKGAASPKWHSASPNNEPEYEHDLSEGEHTLEFATDYSGRLFDEIFVGSDSSVLGAYGMSQGGEDSGSAPTVDGLSMSEVETKNSDAEFDVSWDVGDDDGDLDGVDLTLTRDADGTTQDSAALSVSGSSAGGTTRLVAAGDDGAGYSYTVEATVTDSSNNTASATASATEKERVPAVDELSLSEVETDGPDAEFDVSWAVSDDDSDLDSVDLTLTDDTDEETEETVSLSVSGDDAGETTRLVAAGDDGIGNDYTVEATVTDDFEQTDSATATATAAVENESPPTVDGITLTEVETDDPDAEFDAAWAVSDSDGNLSSVELTLTDETAGETEEAVSLSVSGDDASGTTRLVAAGDDGTGNDYTVEATVTDDFDETDSETASAGESENAPAIDSLSASEVETDGSDAEFDVSWDVSDDDGDLSSLDLSLIQDSDDATEDTVSVSVSGNSASETTRLVAAGDDGTGYSYTVEAVVTDVFEKTDSVRDSVEEDEPLVQEPYADHDLSRIEAEDFDTGGEGVAYHDTSDGNKAGAYRDTDVDIEQTEDDSGEYNIGWIRDGEWWEYTVEVPEN